MSKKALIDTNVILVANGQHEEASPACIRACVEAIHAVYKNTRPVLLDDQDGHSWILAEYQNKTKPWNFGSQRTGDQFVLHLLQNNYPGSPVIEKATISPRGKARESSGEPRDYDEFPSDGRLQGFDHPDRKFVAVAAACTTMPTIQVAVDAGFWQHKEALQELGFKVKFLCPKDIKSFHRAKA